MSRRDTYFGALGGCASVSPALGASSESRSTQHLLEWVYENAGYVRRSARDKLLLRDRHKRSFIKLDHRQVTRE